VKREQQLHVWLTAEEWRSLRTFAQCRDISAGELVRRLIRALERFDRSKIASSRSPVLPVQTDAVPPSRPGRLRPSSTADH